MHRASHMKPHQHRPAYAQAPLPAEAEAPAFRPDSMLWLVCRERCSLLDGGAAAVLQVAHPKIAAGVRDHSDFRAGPIGRLQRTLDGVNTIAFGTRQQAQRMADHIARRHAQVKGRVEDADASPASAYAADDPDLLMWVIATLVMAAINGYERDVKLLTLEQKEAFYADMRAFGEYFALPASYGPQTWSDFVSYFDSMLADPTIGSTPVSRDMAWAVAAPRRPWWLRILSLPARFTFTEILPPPVRDRLGFQSNAWTRFCMRVATFLMPRFVPLLPQRLRFAPQYLQAIKLSPAAAIPAASQGRPRVQ